MPCYEPLQGYYIYYMKDGVRAKKFIPSASMNASFREGKLVPTPDSAAVPCGQCEGCRIARTKEWAIRCMHEASCWKQNCYLTLTYAPEFFPKDGSLDYRDFELFLKKLRKKYGEGIRFTMCGEYGPENLRPHWHACIFNFDFPDKVFWKKNKNGDNLFISESLNDLWGMGFCTIGDVTYKSAAYVARYILKKITGTMAEDHYNGRKPEFANYSNRPGIGYYWFEKFRGDVYPKGYLTYEGVKHKPPRYYEKCYAKLFPHTLESIKEKRREEAFKKHEDNTYKRLKDKKACLRAKLSKLVRNEID